MPGDIFGLRTNSSKLYDKQVDNAWPESANYGYFAGGTAPPYVCTIDRIDFSSETVSLPGSSLTRAITNTISTSSSDYGYFGGGFNASGVVDEVDRIDFSNETVAVPSVGNQLTEARNALAGVSGSDYGYYAGGRDPASAPTDRRCTIDRIDFSSETVAVPPVGNQLTEARTALEGVFSSNYGYFAGGTPQAGGYSNTIDRIDFFTETTSAPGNNLTKTVDTSAGVSASNYGYIAGGFSPPYVNTIDRIDFSSETVLEIGGTLAESRQGSAGVFSSKYGYFAGGFDGSRFCTIDRIDFSNETVTAPGTYQLTQARNSVAGVSGRQTRIRRTTDKTGSSVSGYGFYLMNGIPSGSAPGQRNIIDYATETQTTPPVDMAGTQAPGGGSVFTSIDYGYQVRTGTTTLDRYEFKNDTRSALDNLSEAGTGNSFSNNHYGYSCRYLETDGNRYDKSTDTDTSIANIISVSTTRYPGGYSNFSSPYYGWFSMGQTPGLTGDRASIIDRLEFSTETSSSAPVGTSYRRWSAAGGKDLVGSYGYVFGGNTNYVGTYKNTVDKFDMETETFSPAGTYCPSPTGRIDLTVGLSKHYGYIGPGYRPPTTLNRMDRYEFSTNTSTSPSTTMSSPSVRGSHSFPSDVAV